MDGISNGRFDLENARASSTVILVYLNLLLMPQEISNNYIIYGLLSSIPMLKNFQLSNLHSTMSKSNNQYYYDNRSDRD